MRNARSKENNQTKDTKMISNLDPLPSLELLRKRLARNHLARWMGLDIVSAGNGQIEIMAPWREEYISNPDARYVHGGILATLIDTACSYAIATKLGEPAQTVDMRIDYLRPGLPGPLRTRAGIIKLGKTIATIDAHVIDEKRARIACGRAAFYIRQQHKD